MVWSSGDLVRISAESDDFDTYVTLTRKITSPDGETTVDFDDGGGEGRNSELTTTLVASGVHGIWVISFTGTGPFTLTLEQVSEDEI